MISISRSAVHFEKILSFLYQTIFTLICALNQMLVYSVQESFLGFQLATVALQILESLIFKALIYNLKLLSNCKRFYSSILCTRKYIDKFSSFLGDVLSCVII